MLGWGWGAGAAGRGLDGEFLWTENGLAFLDRSRTEMPGELHPAPTGTKNGN